MVHLTRCHSDHCPVLLEMQPRAINRRVRPFKFQSCWLSDASFPKVVTQAWRHCNRLVDAIEIFTKEAKVWNKTQFGNIFSRKKNIMARLNGIQRSIASRPSAFLCNLENELLKELDSVISQEEELWALKSRVNWMIQGDRNTSFYHVSTLVRRKRNQIMAIKDTCGDWIVEESEVKEYIRSGFVDVFSTSLTSASTIYNLDYQWQPRLSEEEKQSISGGGVTDEEIKAALWSLKPFKASGRDGLHAGFF